MKRRIVGGLVGGLLGGALTATFLPPVLNSNADGQSAAQLTSTFEVAWHKCRGSRTTECGILHVPVDWADPTGELTTVAVARRPADDPARRIGTLYFNPGGPGDGAVNYVVNAEQVFSATLRKRFDIVGLDPRGTGG